MDCCLVLATTSPLGAMWHEVSRKCTHASHLLGGSSSFGGCISEMQNRNAKSNVTGCANFESTYYWLLQLLAHSLFLLLPALSFALWLWLPNRPILNYQLLPSISLVHRDNSTQIVGSSRPPSPLQPPGCTATSSAPEMIVGWDECVERWWESKDRDLREREGGASASASGKASGIMGRLDSLESTVRKRLHVKQSIHHTLNMLKARSDSNPGPGKLPIRSLQKFHLLELENGNFLLWNFTF